MNYFGTEHAPELLKHISDTVDSITVDGEEDAGETDGVDAVDYPEDIDDNVICEQCEKHAETKSRLKMVLKKLMSCGAKRLITRALFVTLLFALYAIITSLKVPSRQHFFQTSCLHIWSSAMTTKALYMYNDQLGPITKKAIEDRNRRRVRFLGVFPAHSVASPANTVKNLRQILPIPRQRTKTKSIGSPFGTLRKMGNSGKSLVLHQQGCKDSSTLLQKSSVPKG